MPNINREQTDLEIWQREAYRIYDALGESNDCQGDAFVARTSFLAFLQDRDDSRQAMEKDERGASGRLGWRG